MVSKISGEDTKTGTKAHAMSAISLCCSWLYDRGHILPEELGRKTILPMWCCLWVLLVFKLCNGIDQMPVSLASLLAIDFL